MKIKNAKFIKSVANKSDFFNDYPEIAFVGRSNVGKSSLINALCNQKNLAKTSSTPGKTRLINYFLVNEEFYLVDLPGYGYHRAGKEFSDKWAVILEEYLQNSQKLKLVVVLVDLRIEPTELDKQMIKYLSYYQLPFIIVGTKGDKLSKSQMNNARFSIAKSLCLGTSDIIATSSDKRINLEQVVDALEKALMQNTY